MARRAAALRTAVLFVSASVVSAVSTVSTPARAQHTNATHAKPLAQSLPADARRDYDAGRLLFEDGDYATALLKYQAAYDSTHDARLLWDVAVCQKSLRHYAKALATLSRYLSEGGDALTPGDRRDAQELAKAITPFTSAQTFHVLQEGADVTIGDERVGTSPLASPIVLDIGTRHVRVQKEGFRVWDREVPVGGSAPTDVDVVLEKASGHVELRVPPAATVEIDGQPVGHGPLVALDLDAGPHALRVAAAGTRPVVTDLVVEDGKSRTLDLALEPDTPPVSEVRIAVGCGSPDPLPPELLAVFFDDSTEASPSLGVRTRREPGKEVVAYVPYRVSPGRHTVLVAGRGCESRDTVVTVTENGVTTVTGILEPSDRWFGDSPTGSHDGWRLSAGVVESSVSYAGYRNFFQQAPTLPEPVSVTSAGPSVGAGLETRWTTVLLDARFQAARAGVQGTSVFDATLSQWTLGVRPGVRLPLYIAALSAGVGGHIGQYFFSPNAGNERSGVLLSASLWAAVDIQPWCEWGAQLAGASSFDDYNNVPNGAGPSAVTSFWLHVTYTPNSVCKTKQAGQFRIEGTAR